MLEYSFPGPREVDVRGRGDSRSVKAEEARVSSGEPCTSDGSLPWFATLPRERVWGSFDALFSWRSVVVETERVPKQVTTSRSTVSHDVALEVSQRQAEWLE